MLVSIGNEGDHFLFLACIERASEYSTACRLDLLDKRDKLFALPPSRKDSETLRCEFLGDLAADEIPGADHRHGRVSFLQGPSPEPE
ncbi:Uncharacterised protein [Mycobacterium tuberculosis]|nr:Uncharacterised protein [Mycobacterium tuberculosis]